MATSTYIALGNVTLTGAVASVTFDSISQNYRDLVLVAQTTLTSGSSTASGLRLTFNDMATSVYLHYQMGSNGTTAGSQTSTQSFMNFGGYSANAAPSGSFMGRAQVMDYSTTDKAKVVLMDVVGEADAKLDVIAGRWNSNTALTTLKVWLTNGSGFAAGSTFTLYGVL